MKLKRICITCNKMFEIPKGSSHHGKYCSNICRRKNKIDIVCKICNKVFQVHVYRKETAKYCSEICRAIAKKFIVPWNKGIKTGIIPKTAFKKGHKFGCRFKKGHKTWNKNKPHLVGKDHPNWKGGREIIHGYAFVWSPNHPFKNKGNYVRESHLVAEKYIGRYIKSNEVIHHINKNSLDNRPENLYLFKNNIEHIKHHGALKKNPSIILKSNII